MKACRIALLAVVLALPVVPAYAADDDEPFAEQLMDAEFKQSQTKQEMNRIAPRAIVAPGPEAGPGASVTLIQDRLRVLRDTRADAVAQKKSADEIAALDAQIRDLQRQISPPGQ